MKLPLSINGGRVNSIRRTKTLMSLQTTSTNYITAIITTKNYQTAGWPYKKLYVELNVEKMAYGVTRLSSSNLEGRKNKYKGISMIKVIIFHFYTKLEITRLKRESIMLNKLMDYYKKMLTNLRISQITERQRKRL